jgi:predicted nucleotidyltransferase
MKRPDEFNYQAARDFLEQKEARKKAGNRDLFLKAKTDCEKIIQMLITEYHPLRIYQWGSMLKKEDFSAISDIDIAVEGVRSAEDFFKMFGEAQKMTDFPLDLVEMEKVEPLHAESIRKNGKVVYERKVQ